MNNAFLEAVAQHDTYTENMAISHSTTGDALLDYFAKAGTFRDRPVEDVHADVSRIWAESPQVALQILFYLRMVTRTTKGFFASEKVQKGQGVRDEFRKAVAWVASYHPEVFYTNMWLMPIVGCWKDLWHTDLIDVLDNEKVWELVQRGMGDNYNRALLAKYLPKIRSKRNTYNNRHHRLNQFARGLCVRMGWNEKQYRQFKASGEAHTFQRAMSGGLWDQLDFARIPGKALFQLLNSKGRDGVTTLERHNLEKRYLSWLKTQPVAKFTGYVYELMKAVDIGLFGNKLSLTAAQKYTLDKQFAGLLQLAKKDEGGLSGNVWCALDTSGSMTHEVTKNVSAYDICVSLGIYFSSLNEGAFKDHVIMFDNVSQVKKLNGEFTDKVLQIRQASTAWGSTNFQSVIDEIVRIRCSSPNVPLEDYPDTLLVVSDMQFNPAAHGNYWNQPTFTHADSQTNYEVAMKKLSKVGLGKMRIVWWWVTGRCDDFPSTIRDEGVAMIGGFDGAVITNILGGEQTTIDEKTGEVRQLNAYENMLKALNQEVLTQIKLPVSV
jgi:hypothetical protein